MGPRLEPCSAPENTVNEDKYFPNTGTKADLYVI